jgi:hypothetical protein
VQPIANNLALSQTVRLADEHQKDGLEGIVGIVGVAQDAATDATYHRAMTAHERFKSRLIVPMEKRPQELSVCEIRAVGVRCDSAQLPENTTCLKGRHEIPFSAVLVPSPLYSAASPGD